MAISRDEVVHVARLARLELSEVELERFAEQLSAILEAVGKVSELDLEGVEPTAHPLDLANVWADDEPRPSLSVDEALANAPDREEDSFRVPAARGLEGAA
jgi:aspartyl-tRNA(Asn)/glutamyl-tRNA(Gln) amidotransferase subunit C